MKKFCYINIDKVSINFHLSVDVCHISKGETSGIDIEVKQWEGFVLAYLFSILTVSMAFHNRNLKKPQCSISE
ncbi:CLUMA_CG019886, isoform A [Clunio marinus]|uniref:CLUMA_CG019886, isoform A n=1 Tax=Clunio marinus TaxID=568069 RepID=A0A1J1J500_9DIPT|nr:CLUMA_CG019886, isoform A [Clunio marinus]